MCLMYLSSTDYSGPVYNFTFASQHADAVGFAGQQDQARFRFRASDSAVTSDWVLTGTVAVDNEDPAAPVVADPAAPVTVDADTYELTGTAEADSLVTVLDDVGSIAGTQQLSGGATSFAVTVDLAREADNDFDVTATDAFGNVSPATDAPIITEDSVVLTTVVRVEADTGAPYYTNDATPEIVVSGEAGMVCRWGAADQVYGDLPPENELNIADIQASDTLPNQGADGAKIVYVSCRESGGLEQTTDDNLDIDFTLDTAAPTVVSASATPDPTAAGEVTVTVEFADAGGLDTAVAPTVQVTGLTSDYPVGQTSFVGSTWSGTFTLPDEDDQTVANIAVSDARDLAGTAVTPVLDAGTLAVDTVAPTAELTDAPPAATIETDIDITVGGADVTGYKYNLDSAGWSAEISPTTNITAAGLAIGAHTLAVVGRDTIGNWQTEGEATTVNWSVITAPTADPPAGTYDTVQLVAFESAGAVSIRYTTNGVPPTCVTGTAYTDPLPVGTDTTFEVIACDSDNAATSVSTFVYETTAIYGGDQLSALVAAGVLQIPGGDTGTAATQATVAFDFTVEVTGASGTSAIIIPAGTVITPSGGGTFDTTALAAAVLGVNAITGLDASATAHGVLQWGVAGLGLIFSQPITVRLAVGGSLDGNLLNILRSISGNDGWTIEGIVPPTSCTVTAGICEFTINMASHFTAVTYQQTGGGGGGGGGGGALPTSSDTTPPGSVTNFSATPGDGQILLAWTNPGDGDLTVVNIVRSTLSYPAGPNLGTSIYAANGVFKLDSGLINNQTYYYSAFAYDNSGNYSVATTASAAPQAGLPNPEMPDVPAGGTYNPGTASAGSPTINLDLGINDDPTIELIVPTGSLIKGFSDAVYYYGSDGKRYVFPNQRIYMSWYADFDDVITISDEQLASIPLGGNVTYKPGVRMIKIQSDPKVYAVARGGILRWVTTQEVAEALYGPNWNQFIDDVNVAFFVAYTIGDPITEADLGI